MSDLNSYEESLAIDLAKAEARIEQLERERDLWSETAAMHLRAEQAFLSWLRAAGEHMRNEGVTLCDDGVDSGEILAAKVAECAGLLKVRAEAAEAKLTKAVEALHIINVLDPEEQVSGCSPDALRGLVNLMGSNARAVLAELEGGSEPDKKQVG